MSLVMISRVLNALLALAPAASDVYQLLTALTARLNGVLAGGAEITDADWAIIDQALASKLLAVKGYSSLTEALLQTPSASPAATQAA